LSPSLPAKGIFIPSLQLLMSKHALLLVTVYMITFVNSIADVAAALVTRTSCLWSHIILLSFFACFIYDLTCEMKKVDACLMLQTMLKLCQPQW